MSSTTLRAASPAGAGVASPAMAVQAARAASTSAKVHGCPG